MRMMGKNSRLQSGRVENHGSWCADCKPDEPLGRADDARMSPSSTVPAY